jgi:sugar phosphate isomerase/epimerase
MARSSIRLAWPRRQLQSASVTPDASFPGPPLACSTGGFLARPLRDAFGSIAAAGFEGVEVMVTADPETQNPRRLRELLDYHSLTIRAIHAPFLLMTRKVWGADPIEKIYRSLELAEATGAPLVVVHPPYRWQAKYRRWLDEELPALAGWSDVLVAVENMFPVGVSRRLRVTFYAKQTLDELERIPHLVLDTSHAAVAGLDPVDAFRRLHERVAHIHLSNNTGRGWDSHLPVDRGVLELDGFLEQLAAEGFSGTITLELDLRPYLQDGDALHRLLVRNLEFCRSRLSRLR